MAPDRVGEIPDTSSPGGRGDRRFRNRRRARLAHRRNFSRLGSVSSSRAATPFLFDRRYGSPYGERHQGCSSSPRKDPTLLKGLFGQVVFSVAGAEYRWEDVVLAAELSGDWARLQERVREGIALLRRWEEEPDVLEESEIESAASEFRYQRDLISAEEMEEWLARWGLTAESWMDYVRGLLLRQKWSGDPAGLALGSSSEEGEIEERVLAEAVCSGELRRLASTLAGRAAIAAREAEDGPATPSTGLSRSESLASFELSFQRFCEREVTPEAVEAQIRAGQADWTRLDCRCVSFPNEEAAREAALGVRIDGRTLDEVAGDAHGEIRREEFYIEEAPAESRDLFLGARKGELVGPVPIGDEFLLYLVLDKVLPSESDERVGLRARETVVTRLVEGEMNDRVKWRWRF